MILLTVGKCLRNSLIFSNFRVAKSTPSRRTYFQSKNVVDLHYEQIKAPSSSQTSKGPLLICHGLFGSKQNWRSLSKTFAARLETDVYSLDLRNHGTSPHATAMDYASMASDLLHFCHKHELSNISLIGHSMGGKVAMALALSPERSSNLLSRLVVADIAPNKGALSPEFRIYVDTMQKIEKEGVTSRKEANEYLQAVEPEPSIRAFLLTNLTFPQSNGPVKFRVPIDIVKNSLDDIGGFPYEPGEREWRGKALFIKGKKSKYINKHNIPLTEKFFPNMRLETLEAGHWVHAEKPHEFLDLVVNFVKEMG